MYIKQSIEDILGTILDDDHVLPTPVLISPSFPVKEKARLYYAQFECRKKTTMPRQVVVFTHMK